MYYIVQVFDTIFPFGTSFPSACLSSHIPCVDRGSWLGRLLTMSILETAMSRWWPRTRRSPVVLFWFCARCEPTVCDAFGTEIRGEGPATATRESRLTDRPPDSPASAWPRPTYLPTPKAERPRARALLPTYPKAFLPRAATYLEKGPNAVGS